MNAALTKPIRSPSEDGVITVKKGSARVKIYPVLNRGKQLFMVTWFVAGRRHRRNFADEAEARKEATLVATKLSAGEAQVLMLTSGDRESYLEAKRLLAPLGVPLHDAIKDYVAARTLLREDALLPAVRYYRSHAHRELPRKSVEEVLQEFLQIRGADGASVRYLQDVRSRLGRFAKAFHMDIGDVETGPMDEWLRSLKVAARSRKNFRILLVALFHFARDRGYLANNVTTAADGLPVPKTDDGEIEIYSVEEMAALLGHADDHTLPVLCFGGFAGLRTAEIERLIWENVKWEQNVIEVGAKTSKNRQRRLVPLLSPLVELLQTYRGRVGPVVGKIKLHLRLRQLAQKAGIKWKHNALRHSYASYRLASKQNVAQLALEMGNSPTMIFRHYRELTTPNEALRWWGLGLGAHPGGLLDTALAPNGTEGQN